MSPSMPRPRTAKGVLFRYAETVALVAVTGVSVRMLRRVLLALCSHVDSTTWAGAFPSMATIAERAECSVRAARKAVRALELTGVVVTELGGGRRSNRYRLVRPESAAPTDVEAPNDDTPTRTGQRGTECRRSLPLTSRSSLRSERLSAPAASKIVKPRGKAVPDDLRPLADALVSRGLRAAYGLTEGQADEVRAAMARAGVAAMVSAAYRAHRANDPARWWSAWLGLWTGMHVPSPAVRDDRPDGDVEVVRVGDAAAGAAACRAAINARRTRTAGAA